MYNFDFILLISHKQEVPDSLREFNIPIVSLKALLANDTRLLDTPSSCICIVTGVGYKNTNLSLNWIKAHLNTNLIINIGSCGSSNPNLLNKLICPMGFKFQNKHVYSLGIFPFMITQDVLHVHSCESVLKPQQNLSSDIVDMESFWQAEFCYINNISYSCLKYVTDLNNNNTQNDYQNHINLMIKSFNSIFLQLFSPIISTPTVIIPTYNRVEFLKRSIDSVLNQTVKPECIVVDDGSTDDTKLLLDSYGSSIHVIRSNKNQGVSTARNLGINKSNSQWISFLDSDDQWEKDKLEKQIDYYYKFPFYSVIQSQEHWIRNNKRINKKKHHQKKHGILFDEALNYCVISASSVLINRRVFEKFGYFDEKMRVCEDYELWLRLTRNLIIGLDNTYSLKKYAGHANQLSFSYEAMDRFRVYALKKQLQNEHNPFIKKKIINTITKKESILQSGKLKRGIKSVYDKENLL